MLNAQPQESEQQRIGNMAHFTFDAVKPFSWRTKSLEGTDDAGYDLQIQLVIGGEYQEIFRLQLKGTTTPNVVDKEFLSIQIKLTTFNYYGRAAEPVLFVVADLSHSEDPRACPAYYVWIHEELQRHRNKGLSETQKSVSIRVPLKNKLDATFDVRPVLVENRRLLESGAFLDASLRSHFPDFDADARTQMTLGVTQGIARRSSHFVQAIADTETFWPQAPTSSVAGRLTSVADALKRGDDAAGEAMLSKVFPSLEQAPKLEQAAYWYLLGRIYVARSEDSQAVPAFETAKALAPAVTKYSVALIEAKLSELRCIAGVATDVSDLIREAQALSGPLAVGIHARLLAVSGQLSQARALISSTVSSANAVDAVVIETFGGSNGEVLEACDNALKNDDLDQHAQFLIAVIRARTLMFSAVGLERFSEDAVMFPLGGPANLDTTLLGKAWDAFNQLVPLLRTAGWPRIIEHAVDAWTLASVLTNKEKDLLPHLLAASEARPSVTSITTALERVAMGAGDLDTALAANARLMPEDGAAARRVLLWSEFEKVPECLTEALTYAKVGNRKNPLFALVLCQGILCADALIRPDDAQSLEAILNTEPSFSAQRAILRYMRNKQKNVLSREVALDELYEAYQSHGNNTEIGLQLLSHLPVHDEKYAALFISIAEELEKHQKLPQGLLLSFVQAHFTLSQWKQVISIVDAATRQYAGTGRLKAARALALDKLGHTSLAYEALETILKDHPEDSLAIDAYVNIAMRFGEADAAIALVERILPNTLDHQQRFELTILLFKLVQQKDVTNPRLIEIAWQLGCVANVDVEAEEGQFLIHMVEAQMSSSEKLEAARQVTLARRRDEFINKFPSSRMFRMGTVSSTSPINDIKRMLAEMDPGAEERQNWQRGMETSMERGEIAVPYIWRPQRILGYVNNVIELWTMSKRSRRDARQSHLTMLCESWKQASVPQRTPLIDLPTLCVLHDLDLIEVLFSVFKSVAISQATLMYVQNISSSRSVTFASELAKSMQEKLRNKRHQIIQPTLTVAESTGQAQKMAGDDIKSIFKCGEFSLYTDDAIYYVYVSEGQDSCNRFCTLDLMYAAHDLNLMTIRQVAEKLSLLISWNVGVQVPSQLIIASLPASVNTEKDVRRAAEVIQCDPVCLPIFEGIWSVRRTYQEIHDGIFEVVSKVIENYANSERTIAAIICVWFWKAKLRTDVEALPLYRLALLFVHLFARLPVEEKMAKRLRNIYLSVVEADRGPLMDQTDEQKAIEALAHRAAEFDLSGAAQNSEKTALELRQGWTEGTSDWERFSSTYSAAALELRRR